MLNEKLWENKLFKVMYLSKKSEFYWHCVLRVAPISDRDVSKELKMIMLFNTSFLVIVYVPLFDGNILLKK